MKTFAATEAQNGFGRLLDAAQREPVAIEKKGRPVAVVLSVEDYRRLEELEDTMWAIRAHAAEKEGYLSVEETEVFMAKMLDAED
jgi:prevent-host-death family protein